ncbi:MAG: hypothetical protein AAB441_00280 [Patescibacteria group bacterium]
MNILRYDPKVSIALSKKFIKEKLIYGNGNNYNSLITPSSTCLNSQEVQETSEDLYVLWKLYNTFTNIYLESLKGKAPNWIKKFTEYGMSKEEVLAHRMVCLAGLEPVSCRVDYVSLGNERKIAEVQWKSGGPGLFFGIQDVYSHEIPFDSHTKELGNMVEQFYQLILHSTGKKQPVAVNAVRDVWFNGEQYLQNAYSKRSLFYIPLDREKVAERITEKNGIFFVTDSHGSRLQIDFFNGQGFTKFFKKEKLDILAKASINGKLWIETPLNYIYRQKWQLALPFSEKYKNLFSKKVRDIIIPTVLVSGKNINLKPLIIYMPNVADRFLSIKTIDQIIELPISLREKLILKCGAGTGQYYSDSKGVFRLGGSRSFVKKIIDFVMKRVVKLREPWIIQVYVDSKYEIPLSLPDHLNEQSIVNAHARFMVYGGRFGKRKPVIIGGLGNFGKHWKVTGKAPKKDEFGNLLGTTFNDMRVIMKN